MRQNHFIAIAAAVAIGFTIKVFLLSGPSAEAGADVSKAPSGMDVSRMHVNAKLPMEKTHDMTFVFSDADRADVSWPPRTGDGSN